MELLLQCKLYSMFGLVQSRIHIATGSHVSCVGGFTLVRAEVNAGISGLEKGSVSMIMRKIRLVFAHCMRQGN